MADDEITIKFTIVPEGFSHERKLKKSLTVLELKQQVEADLRIPVNSMKLVFQGQEMLAPTLGEYSFSPTDVNHVELQIVYTDEGQQAPSHYVMPDVISVEVQFGVDIPPKLIQVPIVRAMPEKKAFLGGYRSRKTAIEYHHASSQTDPAPRSAGADDAHQKFHRETQTAVLQTRSQQAVREAGTQMPRGHLKAEDSDTILRPLPYFDSGMVASLRLEKAIDLQRYTRGWFARTAAAALRRAQALAAAESMAEEEKQKYEAEQRHKLEIQRRMHPHSYEDFEILYNEVRPLLSLSLSLQPDRTMAHMAHGAPCTLTSRVSILTLSFCLCACSRSSRRGGCRRRARSMRSTVWTRRSVWRRCSSYCSRSRSCYRRSTGCACRRTTRTATSGFGAPCSS